MNRLPKKKVIMRHLMIACFLIPVLMFFLPPTMNMRLYFHGLTHDGVINVYRSDDAVGYFFRSVFHVDASTTSAYMKGVYENLEDFRVRFTDVGEIDIDGMTLDLYGLRVADLNGKQMADRMAVKKGVTIVSDAQQDSDKTEAASDTISENAAGNPDGASVKLKIAYDGAYFILQPQVYMHAGAWLYYFLILYLIALAAAVPVTGLLFLCGFKNPISEVLFFTMPAFAVSFGEMACGSVSVIPTSLFFLNYFAILGIAVFLRFLTHRRFATAFVGVIFCCLYIANHFVYLFRGRPLLPWDFQAIGTAAEVAGAYDFEMNGRLVALILVAVFLFAAPKLLKFKRLCQLDTFEKISPLEKTFFVLFTKKKKEGTKDQGILRFRFRNRLHVITLREVTCRACGMLAGVLVLVLALKSSSYAALLAEAWDASIIINYQKQGMPMTFVKYMDVYRVSEPEDYGEEILQEIAETYGAAEQAERKYYLPQDSVITTKPQRILMVMNESLSEISYANADEAEQVDTLPFFRSLTDSTIRGSLYVSVRGGGTCNTEFESLTASAMGLLPPNTYPYEAYIKRETQSLASYFSNEGYQVAALHPADRKNWKRNTVYPLLGLEPFYAYDNFQGMETLRGYATDAWDYEQLVELDEMMRTKSESNARNFIFNVTMQNHGGYSPTDDMKVSVDLSEYGTFDQAEVYYSLMKLSDEALRDLIAQYSADETDTMIVIYGDHQPSLGTKTDVFLFDEDPDPLVKYETPFVIWANYELPSIEGYSMSANYLSGLVLEAAGFELTPYLRLVGDCYQVYPIITSYGVLDADGRYYEDADVVPDETGLLWRYRCAQYNNLFDKDRMDELFQKANSVN